MKTNTKYLIGIVAIVLIIAAIAAFGMKSAPSETSRDNPNATASAAPNVQQVPSAQQSQEPTVMPTFMYFVSPNDSKYDDAIKVFNQLASEYGDRVKFELKDVDAEPDLKERFMINQEDSPIPMNTPTLIMLDVHNNISTIGLSECTDKDTLKSAIEKALNA